MTPTLDDRGLTLSLAHTPGMTAVRLDCDRAVPGRRALVRRGDGAWTLTLPPSSLDRLEYRFAVTWRHRIEYVLDPANPRIVAGVFGPRSVAQRAGYAPPAFTATAAGGVLEPVLIEGSTADAVPVTVWSPEGLDRRTAAPLLLVHDGPEYAEYADLLRCCAEHIRSGTLPPHRVALLHPQRRDDWYSGSPDYLDTVTGAVLDTLTSRYAVDRPVVVMGASLGGLTALLVALAESLGSARIGGVFAQSGSFFTARTDGQESRFRYFPRITAYVDALTRMAAGDRPLVVGLTCGALEENAGNNRAVARALSRCGHTVSYREVADLHTYTAWRDSLEPGLIEVLERVWSGGSVVNPANGPAAH